MSLRPKEAGVQVGLRFRGEQVQRTDAKHRLSIPAGYRRLLAEQGDSRLVMVRSLTGPCISVYPAREWERREDIIAQKAQSDPTVVKMLRFQVAGAGEATPDGHGRVLLNLPLRDYAGIEPNADVVVVGQIRHFELWNHKRWQSAQQAVLDDLENWRAQLPELGL